jgi:uncharacterized protein YdhG (YjbR/CyaY superfamily)
LKSEPAVAAYIASQPLEVRRMLKRVRTILRKALPNGQEVISYGIRAYRVNGKLAVFFAGWKNHYSIYPAKVSAR